MLPLTDQNINHHSEKKIQDYNKWKPYLLKTGSLQRTEDSNLSSASCPIRSSRKWPTERQHIVQPYAALKERLTTTFNLSQECRILRLLEETQLEDLRPSQFLHEMQILTSNTVTNEVLKTICSRALPIHTKGTLATISEDDLR